MAQIGLINFEGRVSGGIWLFSVLCFPVPHKTRALRDCCGTEDFRLIHHPFVWQIYSHTSILIWHSALFFC